MALFARHVGMAQSQREANGRRGVVHVRAQPRVEACVAHLALVWGKFRRCRGVRRGRCILPIHHVAGRTGGRKPLILSNRRVHVALVAFHYRVSAKQRKPVEMLLN